MAALVGFTLMTALMSVINYYFFFGQVLFFVLYYMVRWGIRRARASGVKALAAEILRIQPPARQRSAVCFFFWYSPSAESWEIQE